METMQLKIRTSDVIAYLFIILFMYTATSKFFTVKKFASTLAKSPSIGNLNVFVAWAIPTVEIAISLLLIFAATRIRGLFAATALMVTFTAYLIYMVLSGIELPCHCGGVISDMTWQQHIWFNIFFVALGILGLSAKKE